MWLYNLNKIVANSIYLNLISIFLIYLCTCVCIHPYMCTYPSLFIYNSLTIAVIKQNKLVNEFWQNTLLFSHSVVAHSLWPHGLQHTRFPCPSVSPGCAPTHVHWVGDAIRSSHPLSSPSPPAFVFPSIRIFFYWVGSSHQGAKILELPQYSGLISFKIDWFDLLAVQGTLKSLLQHHSSKACILQHSAFVMVQLSHP